MTLHSFSEYSLFDSWFKMTNSMGCYILYPGDAIEEGKLLRLKQQYMLCSASIQDIIVRFKERVRSVVKWDAFPDKVAIQINDTHSTLYVPELLRILIDEEGLSWDQA